MNEVKYDKKIMKSGHNKLPVKQKDIAIKCGLHQTTVSQALRYDPRINKTTLELVHRVAAEMGYDPTQQDIARRMVLRRYDRRILHKVVGLLLPKGFHQSVYYDAIFHGVMDILSPTEYDTVLITPPGDGNEEVDIFQSPTFRRTELDGIIIFAYRSTDTIVKWLRESPAFKERPVVTLIYQSPGCICVGIDYETGEYLAAKHLIELGHRHILHFGVAGDLLPQRIAGIERAMHEANLDPNIYLHLATGADWYLGLDATGPIDIHMHYKKKSGQDFTGTLQEMLHEYPEITGILAWNDPCAHHIYHALKNCGYKVPENYSLIGFDDTDPVIDKNKELTTLRVPLSEIGSTAAKILISYMTGEESKQISSKIRPELVNRNTTSSPCK